MEGEGGVGRRWEEMGGEGRRGEVMGGGVSQCETERGEEREEWGGDGRRWEERAAYLSTLTHKPRNSRFCIKCHGLTTKISRSEISCIFSQSLALKIIKPNFLFLQKSDRQTSIERAFCVSHELIGHIK